MKRKEITVTIYVEINGECHRWDGVTEQRQKEISIELNKRAMQSIGFRPRVNIEKLMD